MNDARPPVRVVLLMDGLMQPRWIADAIADMLASPAVDVVGVVLNGASSTTPRRTLAQRIRNAWIHRDGVLFDRYTRFDARRYRPVGPDPFEELSVEKTLASVPSTVALPRQTQFSDFLDEDALRFIEQRQPDVAIRFGFRILRGPVLALPTHGVWSFHHGDNDVNRGGPAGFWEVMLGWPSTGAMLQRLSEDLDGGLPLARTWTATHPISVNLNRVELYRAATPLLLRTLHALYERGPSALEPPACAVPFQPYSNRLFLRPRIAELSRGVGRVISTLIRRKRAGENAEQWQLAYAFDPKQGAANIAPQQSAFRFRRIVPPADRFWADPFPVQHEGRSYVFFEELPYSTNIGRICVAELTRDGLTGPPRVVLELPVHLSYPFILRHEGHWYMLPEMESGGAQQVFRATAFPDTWEHHTTFDVGQPIVDPTLHHDGTRWWLFAGTRPSPHSKFDELSVFHGATPFGPWTPHAMNPVISDARCARPAGRLFHVGPHLIRPAQDGTPEYGKATVFRRIITLTPDVYHEETSARLDPLWATDLRGTHTINADGQLTMIDIRAAV